MGVKVCSLKRFFTFLSSSRFVLDIIVSKCNDNFG